jgi:hypothetical protein
VIPTWNFIVTSMASNLRRSPSAWTIARSSSVRSWLTASVSGIPSGSGNWLSCRLS